MPIDNPIYKLAQTIGTIPREPTVWSGDFGKRGPDFVGEAKKLRAAIETEIAYLKLGELEVACIPGANP